MSDMMQDSNGDVKNAAEQGAQAGSDAAASAASAARGTGDAASATAKSTVDQVVEGFEKAGGQVADSARTVWESDQRKDIQDSVVKGLSGVAATIEEQVKKIAENPETQKFVGKMETVTGKIVEDVTANKAFQDVAEAVMKGLNSAAAAIEKWLGQQQSASAPTENADASPAQPGDDTQTIDIQRDI